MRLSAFVWWAGAVLAGFTVLVEGVGRLVGAPIEPNMRQEMMQTQVAAITLMVISKGVPKKE